MIISSEGMPFIAIPAAAGVFFFIAGRGPLAVVAGIVCVTLSLFCAFFFRDPARTIPVDARYMVAPCDGTVMEITEENGQKVVRVFLSVFNVHIQRSPVAGTVTNVEYRPGRFLPAMDPQAHAVNEQNIITIATPAGEYVVKQIAGILARRVVAWVKPGDTLAQGQKIGLIKFGSQVDLHMPTQAKVRVAIGGRVVGGETIVAELP
jgi:phosphatidylserine decarboxylase